VITPVDTPAVAIVASLVLQLPPVVMLLSVVLVPEQALKTPEIEAGVELTVICTVALQPVPVE
jgi:hypothetical protein